MKKLAVLVGGEFREFESAHLSWPFLSLDHDFFISTWDTTTEKNPKLNINLHEEVSSARILKHCSNAHINIEPDIMDVDNSKKQRHHWKKLFEMADNTEIEYETAILIRPDISIIEKQNLNAFISNINDFSIYVMGSGITLMPPPTFIYINDSILIGKYKVVKDAILSLPDFDISKYNVHYHIAKHFVNTDIHVKSLYDVIDAFVMRSSHRDKLHLPIGELKIIAQHWWDTLHLN